MNAETNTQRDELARDIFVADNSNQSEEAVLKEWEKSSGLAPTEYAFNIADGLIAAGYRKPRTITTVEELDALPVGSVAHSAAGTIASRFDEHFGVVFGDERPFEWARLRLPATILYTPEAAE